MKCWWIVKTIYVSVVDTKYENRVMCIAKRERETVLNPRITRESMAE
jgi:hypothetical protein